ncbi:MAG: Obg family GTPase CgtA, partial [Ilumatobacteraceae bacterium]
FLRHVERARVMCIMLDLAAVDEASPCDQERILLHELGEYRPELLDRPRVIVGSKADIALADWEGLRISAVTGEGVRTLVGQLAALVHEARTEQTTAAGIVILRPEAEGGRVERLGEHEFRLLGRQVERIVALNDVSTPDAMSYIDFQMKRLGVPRLLSRAGAQDGDIVWVADFSFEYQQEA